MKSSPQKKNKVELKKRYRRPKLKVYGSVADLTRASVQGIKNDGGSPGPHKIS